jgi:type VII secretion integral membrane protein EccD
MRFTRVTVTTDGRRIDLSVPAAQPVAELVPLVVRLLSLPPSRPPVAWALTAPAHGRLDPRRTLDEIGVLDGDVLTLAADDQVDRSPYVEDVLDGAADVVDADVRAWSGAERDAGVGLLLTGLLLVLVVLLATIAPPTGRYVGLAAVAVAALAGARWLAPRGGAVLGTAAVPALLVLAWTGLDGTPLPVRALGCVAATAAGVALAGLAAPGRRTGLIAGGLVATVAAGVAAAALDAGARPDFLAAGGAVAAVVALALGPGWALTLSRLVGLVRRDEDGGQVPLAAVREAVAVGQSLVNAIVWPTSVAAAVAGVTLVAGELPSGQILAGVLGLVFALRSRLFSRRTQVLAMLLVPLAVAVGAGTALPARAGVDPAGPAVGVTVLLLVAVAVLGWGRLGEVARARTSRWLDRLETVAVVALVPLAVVLLGGLDWVRSLS